MASLRPIHWVLSLFLIISIPMIALANYSSTLPFILNEGQLSESVHACAKVQDLTILVLSDGAIQYLMGTPGGKICVLSESIQIETLSFSELDKSEAKINSLVGKPSEWTKNIKGFYGLSYGEIIPGISMDLKVHTNNIEKIFTLAPYSNPDKIQITFSENTELVLNNGKLKAVFEDSEIEFTPPIAWQIIGEKKVIVDVAYTCSGNTYGFEVGAYDQRYELFIDPLISSTYLGGNNFDGGWPRIDMVLDSNDNVIISSTTFSIDFPVDPDAYNNNFSGYCMAYIAKFNPDLSELLTCTFIGGSGDDFSYALDIDSQDNIYITGHTPSSDFPTTSGAYDEVYNGPSGEEGGDDVFIVKLNSDLDQLLASTFLGSEGWEMGTDIEVGSNGDVYLTGWADSDGFPTTENAFDSEYNNNHDMFVARLNSDLTQLVASTYLGGACADNYPTLAVDNSGNVYVALTTADSNYPVTEGTFDSSLTGGFDGAVSHLSADMTTLISSTYFGGNDFDFIYYISLDDNQDVLISGHTTSTDIPGTETGAQPTIGGGPDGFIVRMNHELTDVINGTYLGGNDNDNIMCQVLDNDGNIFVSGYTSSSYFPTTTNAYDREYNGLDDGFIAKYTSNFRQLLVCTYFGGSDVEFINNIVVDSDGFVTGSGTTRSNDLPMGSISYDPIYNGAPQELWQGDAFIVKLDSELSGSTSVDENQSEVPGEVEIRGCYPNPFNTNSIIEFSLNRKSNVNLTVFDINGRLIEKIINGVYRKGSYEVMWNASNLPSGTYFVKLETSDVSIIEKMTLLK